MSANVTFTASEKEALITKIKAYFIQELDQEVGSFDAEFLLDFFSEEVGKHYYNKGLYDGMEGLKTKLDIVVDDVCYNLEKPTTH